MRLTEDEEEVEVRIEKTKLILKTCFLKRG
ncbi:hypothetical protein [Chitinophaga terrae (ex Kim and Jung 2007)]